MLEQLRFLVRQGPLPAYVPDVAQLVDGCGRVLAELVAVVKIVDAERRAGLGQTAAGNQSTQTARRVGAAAEPEDENLVAVDILVEQPAVGFPYVLGKPHSNRASQHLLEGLRSHAGVVEDSLLDAIGAMLRHE